MRDFVQKYYEGPECLDIGIGKRQRMNKKIDNISFYLPSMYFFSISDHSNLSLGQNQRQEVQRNGWTFLFSIFIELF